MKRFMRWDTCFTVENMAGYKRVEKLVRYWIQFSWIIQTLSIQLIAKVFSNKVEEKRGESLDVWNWIRFWFQENYGKLVKKILLGFSLLFFSKKRPIQFLSFSWFCTIFFHFPFFANEKGKICVIKLLLLWFIPFP